MFGSYDYRSGQIRRGEAVRVDDRPEVGPVWALVCGIAAITLVLVATLAGGIPWVSDELTIGVILLLILLAGYNTIILVCRSDPARRGVGAVLLIVGTSASLLAFIAKPWTTWTWLQFVLLLAIVGVTAWLLSSEWSQRWFLRASALLVVLTAVYILRAGYVAERASVVERPITQALRDQAILEAEANRNRDESELELNAAKKEAEDELQAALPAAPSQFREAGKAVLEHLVRPQPDLPAARVEVARIFALDVPQTNQIEAQTLRDKAKAAVDAHGRQTPSVPDTSSLDEALEDACAHARASNLDVKGCPKSSPEMTREEELPQPETEAVLRRLSVELAYYRAAVTEADGDKVAAEAAATAPAPDLELSMWASLLAGPEAIADSIDPVDPARLVPGPVGWLLLGASFLAFLRVLQKRNACQVAGPVQVNYKDTYETELRMALLSNLPAPASAPGSTVLESITDLSSLAGPGGKTLESISKAVNAVLARGHGYIVDAVVASPPENPAPSNGKDVPTPDALEPILPTRVLVSVSLASTKESVANYEFEDAVPGNAMRAAGLWAAGLILDRSTRIPSWASWNQQTAKALATASMDNPTLVDLEEAVRAAPTSGIVLQLYGGKLELAGRNHEAIGIYARAVALYPRYLTARYRLAVSLGMASRATSDWTVIPIADRAAILHALHHAAARVGIDPAILADLADPDPATAFKELAVKILKNLEEDASWWKTTSASMRRSDRDAIWRPSTRSRFPWRRWKMDRLRAASARLAYLSPDDSELKVLLEEIEKAADDPLISWQLSYNLACYYAQVSEGEALRRLEDCLLRPDVNELTAEWVRTDPDLTPISGHPRFERFAAQLEGKA